MSSTLAWLDFSESDRKKMKAVIDLFKDEATRDELGIGGIRDAMGDILFPGTSTIQTRARYFLFIPWLCKKLEDNRVPPAQAQETLNRWEAKLIDALIAGSDKKGIIGIEARDNLQQFPSEIYWAGLRQWGIARRPTSMAHYFRSLNCPKDIVKEADDGSDSDQAIGNFWDLRLPPAPKTLLEETDFRLERPEAEYLEHTILPNCAGTLLTELLMTSDSLPEVAYPWDLSIAARLPITTRNLLVHGEMFSLVMHGAFILYNCFLAQKSERHEDLERHKESLEEWATEIQRDFKRVIAWDVPGFRELITLKNPRIGAPTWQFVLDWIEIAIKKPSSKFLLTDTTVRSLLEQRETRIKGPKRARLVDPGALARWTGDSGTQRLNYRWHKVQILVSDIREGNGVK